MAQNTRAFVHVNESCNKPEDCRIALHYELFNSNNQEIKDTFQRIEMMRRIWH